MTDLAIVIVNYNVRELLRTCLRSIQRASESLNVDVWLVDNGSSDGSSAMLRQEFPWVHLRETGENLGFARANNLALRDILKKSDGDDSPRYVLLLNPDTEVPRTALTEMVEFLDNQPEAGAAGPRLIRGDGSLDLACRRAFPTPEVAFYRLTGLSFLFPRSHRFGRYNMGFLASDVVAEVDSVVGAFMMVRARVARDVGLLDESFFMYGEDLDWAFRIKQAGWKVLYNGAVTAFHYKRASSSQRNVQSLIAFYEAMLIFFRKHYARQTVWPLRWLVVATIYLRAGIALALNQLKSREMARSEAIR